MTKPKGERTIRRKCAVCGKEHSLEVPQKASDSDFEGKAFCTDCDRMTAHTVVKKN